MNSLIEVGKEYKCDIAKIIFQENGRDMEKYW